MSIVLKILRTINNCSQQHIADELNITKASYNKKENGKNEFTLNEARFLANHFNVPINSIVNMPDEKCIAIILDSLNNVS